jgi:hypothetical protein
MQMLSQQLQSLFQLPALDPLLEPAVACLVGRIFLRQFPPLRPGTQNPEHAIKNRPRIVPWTAAIVHAPMRAQHRFHHRPLFIIQFPASCHS